MIKNASRLQLRDLTETKKRVGSRELGEAKLKLVTGGLLTTIGGSCTTCDDCDQ